MLQTAEIKDYNQTMMQQTLQTTYPRFIANRLAEALEDSPVVLIQGPRQCGKTTLARTLCAAASPLSDTAPGAPGNEGYGYLSFDDDVLRAGAEADPTGFVERLPDRVVLDEVHRAPGIFAALKLDVDRQRTPGRFLLTGSTNVLAVPTLEESLAGRLEVVPLHPLAQCELHAAAPADPGFLDEIFSGDFRPARVERLGPALAEIIVSGGYPPALARVSGRRRANWYRNYVAAQVQRDVGDISRIRSLDVLPRLLSLAAAQTAQLFNVNSLSDPFQLSRPTIGDYLTLLERVYLLERLPPWFNNLGKRLIKTPKLHLGDTGLACGLLGLSEPNLHVDRARLGHLAETFVFQELRKQASWHTSHVEFFHYRDRDQYEVDIVMECGGRVAGVEVKAGATVTPADFRGLRRLRDACSGTFVAGAVLYDGEFVVSFGESMYAVPIRMLWEAN